MDACTVQRCNRSFLLFFDRLSSLLLVYRSYSLPLLLVLITMVADREELCIMDDRTVQRCNRSFM